MRFEQLEYVAAIVEHGSLRQASKNLHISQPAMSEAVGNLERELGVTLLDRRRTGARADSQAHHVLQHIWQVIDAVEELRSAASDHRRHERTVRIGTVNTATTTLLAPALRAFSAGHATTGVEIRDLRQRDIETGLEEGSLDIGLVNLLDGDDPPAALAGGVLVHGRPIVVLPGGHRLAAAPAVTVDDLRAEPFVMMRTGYLMNRFAHRLFGAGLPPTRHTADGAEMGKLLVTQGLGLCLLPDFSVVGDPLERAGLITARPLAGDESSTVRLALLHRRLTRVPEQTGALIAELRAQAETYRTGGRSGSTAG